MVLNILLAPEPFGVIPWGCGPVPSKRCVGLLLANCAYKLQQVPFSETAAPTKSHYHRDSIGCPSRVPHRICFKELSNWQPGEMGGLCFSIHSQEKAEHLATLSHKDSNCWEMNLLWRQGALQPCGSLWLHCAEYCPCPLGKSARHSARLESASSFRKLPAKERCGH